MELVIVEFLDSDLVSVHSFKVYSFFDLSPIFFLESWECDALNQRHVLVEIFNGFSDLTSYLGSLFVIIIESLGKSKTFLVPLGYVFVHILISVRHESVLDVLILDVVFDHA
jgi:hypothetical protein